MELTTVKRKNKFQAWFYKSRFFLLSRRIRLECSHLWYDRRQRYGSIERIKEDQTSYNCVLIRKKREDRNSKLEISRNRFATKRESPRKNNNKFWVVLCTCLSVRLSDHFENDMFIGRSQDNWHNKRSVQFALQQLFTTSNDRFNADLDGFSRCRIDSCRWIKNHDTKNDCGASAYQEHQN